MKIIQATSPRRVGALCVLAVLAAIALPVRDAPASIYWTNHLSIGQAGLGGAPVDPSFLWPEQAGAIASACGMAIDSRHIYWADDWHGSIGRANLDGGSPDYTFITGIKEPCGVAVNDTHVFWASTGGNSIGRARLDGAEQNHAFVSAVTAPCGVAVNSTFVFWASNVGPSFSYVGRALLSGDKGPFLAEGGSEHSFCGVAANESHVFWGSYGDAIGRVGANGSDPEPRFITEVHRPCGVTIHDSQVFWAEQTGGRIGRAQLDGSGIDRGVVQGVGSVNCGIAVDGHAFRPAAGPPPRPASHFTFGRIKRNPRKAVTFIAVDVPSPGFFRVDVPLGIRGALLSRRGHGSALASGGRKWLKLWPGKGGVAARQWRRAIGRKGRVRVVIDFHYMEPGKAMTSKRKRLALVRTVTGRS